MEAIDNCFFRPLQTLDESVACIQEFVKNNKITNFNSQPLFFNTSPHNSNFKLIPDYYSYRIVFEKYFEEICCIYKDIKNLIDNNEDYLNILDNIKSIYYMPQDRLEKIIKSCINSIKSKLGLIYVLLTVDGFDNCNCDNSGIFITSIDSKFRLKIKNDDLYDINVCNNILAKRQEQKRIHFLLI